MKKLIVSPAPHIHSKENTKSLMRDVMIALSPTVLVSIYFFGLSAIKLILVGVISCVLVEYLIQKYLLKTKVTINDYSAALTGVLLALNLPPSSPWWLILIGSIVAIGVAKMTFGGLGQNIFNPALVGRVFLLVSFPALMTDWSIPQSWFREGIDAVTGPTPLAMVKEGLLSGQTIPEIFAANSFTTKQMLFVKMGGSVGEISAVALVIGFIYLLIRRVIKPTIPVTIVCTVALISTVFYLVDPMQ